MVKRALILASFVVCSMHASFRVGESISYEKEVTEHAQALEQFEPFYRSIVTKIWRYSNVINTHTRYMPTQEYTGADVQEESNKYWLYHAALKDKILANAAGNGFIIGFCGALLNRLLTTQGTDWRALGGTVAGSAALVFYQNRQHKIPYIGNRVLPNRRDVGDMDPFMPTSTTGYEIKENLLSEYSDSRFARCCASAVTSFYLTKWALDCLFNKKEEPKKEEEQLNQLIEEKKQ